MRTYIDYELHFKTAEEAKNFSEKNYYYFDYFQFENDKGTTFGYIDNSTVDTMFEIKGNIIYVSQRYKDEMTDNEYYKRKKDSDEDIEIEYSTFFKMLKSGQLTEVGFFQSNSLYFEYEVKNIKAEFNEVNAVISESLEVLIY